MSRRNKAWAITKPLDAIGEILCMQTGNIKADRKVILKAELRIAKEAVAKLDYELALLEIDIELGE